MVEAIEQLPADAPDGDIPLGAYDALEDELGDLLFQVMIQSVLASEAGAFTDRRRRARACTPSSFAGTRTCSATSQVDDADDGRHQLGADQEGREGRRVARRGRHGRAPALIAVQKLLRKADAGRLRPGARHARPRRRRGSRAHAGHRSWPPAKCTTSTPESALAGMGGTDSAMGFQAHGGNSPGRAPGHRSRRRRRGVHPSAMESKCDDSGTVRAFVRVTDTGGCSCGDGRAGWRPDAWRSRCLPRRAPGSHRRFRPLGPRPPSPQPRSTARTGATAPADEPPRALPTEFDRDNYKRTSLRDPARARRLAAQPVRPEGLGGRPRAGVSPRAATTCASRCSTPASSGATPGAMARPRRRRRTSTSARPRRRAPVADAATATATGASTSPTSARSPTATATASPIPRTSSSTRSTTTASTTTTTATSTTSPAGTSSTATTTRSTPSSYGHGTGEAEDSTAAENGTGDVGTCPQCRFLPVRVGDSFIADGGRFARRRAVRARLRRRRRSRRRSARSATRRRRSRRSTPRTGAACRWSRRWPTRRRSTRTCRLARAHDGGQLGDREAATCSAGDRPGLPRAQRLHELRRPHVRRRSRRASCSSEATGQSAGMVGLLESTLAVGVDRRPRRAGSAQRPVANEVMQIVRATADDVDFSTPNAVDPANNFGTPTGGLLDTVRYPTTPGWDATFGYGRVNAYEMREGGARRAHPARGRHRRRRAGSTCCRRTGTVTVTGRVAAAARDVATTTASSGRPACSRRRTRRTDTWHVVAQRDGPAPRRSTGALGTLDLAAGRRRAPGRRRRAAGRSARPGRPDEERFSVRLRVVVTAHGGAGDGLTGESAEAGVRARRPRPGAGLSRSRVAGASTSSPVFADLDGKTGDEMVVATDDGASTRSAANGRELRGWPVQTATVGVVADAVADGARPTTSTQPGAAITSGAPVVADLDGDGNARGRRHRPRRQRVGWDRRHAPARLRHDVSTADRVRRRTSIRVLARPTPAQDQFNRTKPGFARAPVGGRPRRRRQARDRRRRARPPRVRVARRRHAGRRVPGAGRRPGEGRGGRPGHAQGHVHGRLGRARRRRARRHADARRPHRRRPTRDRRSARRRSTQEPPNIGDGASMLALLGARRRPRQQPPVRDLARRHATRPTPTDRPRIPTTRRTCRAGRSRSGSCRLELLPTIGDGVSTQAAVGDVNPAPRASRSSRSSAAGPPYVLDADGPLRVRRSRRPRRCPLPWAGGLAGEGAARFGAQRNTHDIASRIPVVLGGSAIGRLDGDERPDVAAPTLGFTRLLDILAPDLQLPNDDQLSGWQGSDRRPAARVPAGDLGPGVLRHPRDRRPRRRRRPTR